MLEIEPIRYAPGIATITQQGEQPGIPARATHHLFTRRVGSPGYGEGSSQGQKGAALAGSVDPLVAWDATPSGGALYRSMKGRAHPW